MAKKFNLTKWAKEKIFGIVSTIFGGISMLYTVFGKVTQTAFTTDAVVNIIKVNWFVFLLSAWLFIAGLIILWRHKKYK